MLNNEVNEGVTECQCYWLEVMYPLSLATRLAGEFSLHVPRAWAEKRYASVRFLSQDERKLKPGMMMQSDYYFFKRREKADESFKYARNSLSNWCDSDLNSEYLVTLRRANNADQGPSDGELLDSYVGCIGAKNVSDEASPAESGVAH